jgi:uncharacterized protein YhaN
MYIEKLDIISFGKYQNKEIDLTDGINVIYGDNEAGKSTIHKFIEGMFYGFYKPYRKNKQFSLDYDRFLPWNNSNNYRGILVYNHERINYRIERNFMKRNDKVDIFDDNTGDNISEQFEYDSVTKLYQPASRHMEINKSTFNNTISIGQLSCRTSDDLVKEVKDSLINLGESKDEEISIRNVTDKLNKKLDEIGTATRKKTTPYGKLAEEIKKLKKEKIEAEKVWEEVVENQEQLNIITDKLKKLQMRKNDIDELLEYLNKEEIKNIYEEGLHLKRYIDDKTSQLKSIEHFRDVDVEIVDEVIKKLNTFELCKQQYKELKAELLEIDNYLEEETLKYNQVKMLENEDVDYIENILGEYSIYKEKKKNLQELKVNIEELKTKSNMLDENSIIEDEYKYTKLAEELKELKNINSGNIQLKEQNYQYLIVTYRKSKLISLISLIVFIISIGINIISNKNIIVVSAVIGCILIYSLFNYRNKKRQIEKLQMDINKSKIEDNINKDKLNKILNEQNKILEKYQCTEYMELRNLKDKTLHMKVIYEENKQKYEKASVELDKLEVEVHNKEERLKYYINLLLGTTQLDINNIKLVCKKYDIFKYTIKNIKQKKEYKKVKLIKFTNIKEELNKLNEYIKAVTDEYNAHTEKELKEIKEKKYLYYSSVNDINNKKEMLSRLLGDNTLEELKEKLTKYNSRNITTNKSKDEVFVEQDNLINDILHLNKEITSFETQIVNLQKDVRPIIQIEEDISIKSNKKMEFDKKIKALTMAKEAIEEISIDIQNNFAPKLNEKVSDVISKITNEKYNDIKINPNMEILTYEPENHELISIESLSKGTIDQMYFGLRLGITNIIKEDISLPLILDDCFVQYDVERLKMVLKALGNLNRQIIILSCHKRERQILEELGIKFNYIEL